MDKLAGQSQIQHSNALRRDVRKTIREVGAAGIKRRFESSNSLNYDD